MYYNKSIKVNWFWFYFPFAASYIIGMCSKSVFIFQRDMGVSSSHSRVQTLPLTWCSIGGAWSAVPLPPPQRSVRWPVPLSTRVLITQYRVTLLIWSEPIKRLLVYCCFRDFKVWCCSHQNYAFVFEILLNFSIMLLYCYLFH